MWYDKREMWACMYVLQRGGRLFKYGVSFTQFTFNSLLCGMAIVNDDGERVFVRRGNSCCDEERVLGIYRSNFLALIWITRWQHVPLSGLD